MNNIYKNVNEKVILYLSDKYKIYDKDKTYFITITIIEWINIFTRSNHKLKIIESLTYYQQNKGLTILDWCLMPNHLHMIYKTNGDFTLSEILRNFKKFTAKAIINQIENEPKSRRKWMLSYFKNANKSLKRIKNYKF